MEDQYQNLKDLRKSIFDKYNVIDNKNEYDYYSNGWYDEIKSKREPTMWELLAMIEKLIKKNPKNINQVLEALPEEEIQKFLRAKKLAKIKSK